MPPHARVLPDAHGSEVVAGTIVGANAAMERQSTDGWSESLGYAKCKKGERIIERQIEF